MRYLLKTKTLFLKKTNSHRHRFSLVLSVMSLKWKEIFAKLSNESRALFKVANKINQTSGHTWFYSLSFCFFLNRDMLNYSYLFLLLFLFNNLPFHIVLNIINTCKTSVINIHNVTWYIQRLKVSKFSQNLIFLSYILIVKCWWTLKNKIATYHPIKAYLLW